MATLDNIALDRAEYVDLLRKIMAHNEKLQNNPANVEKLVPQEDLVVDVIMTFLAPVTYPKGKLHVEKVCHDGYKKGAPNMLPGHEGRSNLMLRIDGTNEGEVMSLMGSHMDVVMADPSSWKRTPFGLQTFKWADYEAGLTAETPEDPDGDVLYGRGSTDCLGHCAMMACLFKHLAQLAEAPGLTIYGVLISSEENGAFPVVEGVKGCGVEFLMQEQYLEPLKAGPVIWIDSADSQPCIGTAGALVWTLRAEGKKGHSGLPYNAINALELVNEACKILQDKFYKAFPHKAEEVAHLFKCGSTMKPTQTQCTRGNVNAIPDFAELKGDIRLNPFYNHKDVIKTVLGWVDELNRDLDQIPIRGDWSRYGVEEQVGDTKKKRWGKLVFTFDNADAPPLGVACSTDSKGFFALCEGFAEAGVKPEPYSISGSLPLVQEMKESGYDLQITGFGKSKVYHQDDEFVLYSEIATGYQVLKNAIRKVNDKAWNEDFAAGKKKTQDHIRVANVNHAQQTFNHYANKVMSSPEKLHRVATGVFDPDYVASEEDIEAANIAGSGLIALGALAGLVYFLMKRKPAEF